MDVSLLNNADLLKASSPDLKGLAESFKALTSSSDEMSPTEKARHEKAARGFESLFVHLLMKEMKSALLDEFKEDGSGGTFGADTLSTYSDLLFSEEVSNSGVGIGIADMLYRQFTGESLPYKTASRIPSTTEAMALANQKTDNLKAHTSSNPSSINPLRGNFWERINSRLSSYEDAITNASEQHSLPKNLIKAVITAESAGIPNAKSSAGAKGLMQLMDATAGDLGVRNSFDANENIAGGSKYLSQMMNKYGDVNLALAAYNAGPGNVDKYGGVPPFKETQNYVTKVKRYFEMFGG